MKLCLEFPPIRPTAVVKGNHCRYLKTPLSPENAPSPKNAGEISAASCAVCGSSAAVAYTYDELGRVTNRTIDGSNNSITTTYDSLGRVTGVSNLLGAFTYAYVNTTTRLDTVTYPTATGLSTKYSYYNNTGDQRLQTIQNFKSSGTVNVSKFDYTYNPVGTIATWTTQADSSTAIVNTLSYDDADQLTNAVQSGGGTDSNAYYYDPAGNRLTEVVNGSTTNAGKFNPLNQLTDYTSSTTATTVTGYTSAPVSSVTVNAKPVSSLTNGTNFSATVPLPKGNNTVSVVAKPTTGPITTKRYNVPVTGGTTPTALSYDANGNTTQDENGNQYAWDALNRLTRITYPSGASSEFAYDGLSRRISITEKNSGGTTTLARNYLWIGSAIAEERNTSNTITKRFYPQGERQSAVSYYYLRDHLGSVREMCDSGGSLVSRLSYDPYGKASTVSGSNLPFYQYAGLVKHSVSSSDMAVFRFYKNGRWLSRDLLGESAGLNLFRYAKNNAVNFIDPLGLIQTPPEVIAELQAELETAVALDDAVGLEAAENEASNAIAGYTSKMGDGIRSGINLMNKLKSKPDDKIRFLKNLIEKISKRLKIKDFTCQERNLTEGAKALVGKPTGPNGTIPVIVVGPNGAAYYGQAAQLLSADGAALSADARILLGLP